MNGAGVELEEMAKVAWLKWAREARQESGDWPTEFTEEEIDNFLMLIWVCAYARGAVETRGKFR